MSQRTEEAFQGVIGRTVDESVPYWPQPAQPAEGAPNVVLVLLDDLGFAHLGCYGSDISTPNIDALAANGVRFSNFHTTAICSPTRASLLTGRNPHAAGVSFVAHADSGFPNSRGKIGKDTALISEILQENGYNTFAVGKWHLVPGAEHSSAGPFDNWPLGRGFERYYGFLGGATSQWQPELVEDNRRVTQPKSPEEGYHLTEDLTDHAISLIRDQKSAAPSKPFFCYLAYGATHAPHHAPQAYIDKYKGKYDKGWDRTREEWFERQKELGIIPKHAALPPRSPDVKAWDSLSADERRLYARMQEAFAGFLEHTDDQIGRLTAFLRSIGQLDNTLFLLLSDNGACAMGGPEGSVNSWAEFGGVKETFDSKLSRIDQIGGPQANNHYPAGWAQVGNTPLRWYKSFVHAGGVKDPLIVHYPNKWKDKGTIRSQYHHVSDIVPTILEIAGIEPPQTYKGVAQKPIHGVSLAYALDNAEEPTRKTVQVFEMVGNRAIYHEGWKAVAIHKPDSSFDDDIWELYDLEKDYSEVRDLAQEQPERLRQLIALWWQEADKNGLLPLDGRSVFAKVRAARSGLKDEAGPVRRVYYASEQGIHGSAAPDLRSKPFQITVKLKARELRRDGVLISHGDNSGGYVWYIRDNRLRFYFNHSGAASYEIRSTEEIPEDTSTLAFVLLKTSDDEGIGRLYAEGLLIGEGRVGNLQGLGFPGSLLHVGRSGYSTVHQEISAPFAFGGTITEAVYTLGGYESDLEASLALELATE